MGLQPELAFFLVLTAAFLHASWNAMMKGSADKTLTMGFLCVGHAVFGLVLAAISDAPDRASWIYIFLTTVIHWAYFALLIISYRLGDLSQVYPIARGLSPVLVAVGAFFLVGEILPWMAWVGILMVSAGIGMLAFASRHAQTNKLAVVAALMTSVTIAAYSVVDGMGVRVSGSPIGYIGWAFIFESWAALFIFYLRRRTLLQTSTAFAAKGVLGGVISATAYGLVIYAYKIAPMGAVSAVRESSVIIAALIGVVLFKERPWKIRILSAFVVAFGVMVLAWYA